MILLDTNALIWSLVGHPRAAPLERHAGRLRISPVAVLEIKFLREVGRIQAADGVSIEELVADSRWKLDSPSSAELFSSALALDWTRDPFDRLLVAHALYRRWRLATGDSVFQTQLAPDNLLPL